MLPRILAAAVLAGLALAAPADAREPLGNKWRVTEVDIVGAHVATYDDGDRSVQLNGTAFYNGASPGEPFVMRLSQPRPKVIVAKGVTYRAVTEASFSTPDRSYDCDDDQTFPAGGLAAVMMVGPNGIRVQWSLSPAGYRCPADAPITPSFPVLPAKASISRVPVRRFANRTKARIPLDIEWRGTRDGWTQKIVWRGHVVVRRLRAERA